MICFPRCKINLGLFVTGRRPDGYHDLETLFYPLTLSDALEMVPASDFSFTAYNMPVPTEAGENIAEKAWRMVADDYSLPPAEIHLIKRIPVGSGLGGGSSDAVAVLKCIKELFVPGMTEDALYAYARRLGSDCAFFVDARPKLAFGKGDVFEDISFSLAGYHLMLVVPPVHVSTAEAYSNIKAFGSRASLRHILNLPPEDWKFELYNDFEYTIFKKYPRIAAVKEKLYKAGALYASMSGSGSAVYGLFHEKPEHLNFRNCFAWHEELGI